jgi:rhamnosyltransferase
MMIEDQSHAAERSCDFGAGSVCAIVVTYCIGARIFDCINSVIGQVGAIIIVDNGSGNDTLAALQLLGARPQIRVIYNPTNLGIAAALNQGVRCAVQQGYRWVLTMDHDSEATPGMVEKLLHAYNTLGKQIGIVAASPFDTNTRMFQRADIDPAVQYVFTKAVISSGSLIDITVFHKIGFFNEALFIYYVDDDFCLRVFRSGLKIVLCCEALLLHREGSKVIKYFGRWRLIYDRQVKEAKYYIARNGVYLALKYPRDTLFGYRHLRRMAADFVKILLYDECPLPKAGYLLKGLWDGIRGRYGGLDSSQPAC